MASHLRTTGCHRSMVLTILLADRHKRAHPALTPASEGWYSIYLSQRDGRLSGSKSLKYKRSNFCNQLPNDLKMIILLLTLSKIN